MLKQYAFYFDSSACSGCKACQIACKDRNGLRTGLLWRRIYEVSGGEWIKSGDAWIPDIYVYYLSVSCNHCEKPVCQEVCPSGAIKKGDYGIVIIDGEKCLGCRYCSWACPYGAPQYDEVDGRMTKCNLCIEDLNAGLPPACVAACPQRALEWGEREVMEEKYVVEKDIFPLPIDQLTSPALLITPHRSAIRVRRKNVRVSNYEEVWRK